MFEELTSVGSLPSSTVQVVVSAAEVSAAKKMLVVAGLVSELDTGALQLAVLAAATRQRDLTVGPMPPLGLMISVVSRSEYDLPCTDQLIVTSMRRKSSGLGSDEPVV